MILKRQCNVCKIYNNLTVVYFRDGYNKGVRYFDKICRKCCKKDFEKPNFIRQAIIGHKDEPYYPGENFEYIAPTYEQILKEYENN